MQNKKIEDQIDFEQHCSLCLYGNKFRTMSIKILLDDYKEEVLEALQKHHSNMEVL